MKWLFILVALVIVFSLILGCSSTKTSETPATQIPTPTTSITPKYTLLVSVTPADGGAVKIANPPDGEFDYDTLEALAEIKTNYSSSYEKGKSLMLAAKAAEGYVFDSWSGDLSGESDVLYIDIESNINIVANFKVTKTQTTSPAYQSNQVSIKATTNKTSLTIGESLTIQSEIEYIGDEATFSGIPIIIIFDSNYHTVNDWYLDQDGNIFTEYNPSLYYEIEKNKKYIMNITWDLKNLLNASVPSGQYTIQIGIFKNLSDGRNELLTASGGIISITITNNTPEPTPTPTPTPTPSTQNYEVSAKTNFNKTSLSIGENLTIQSELEYVGDDPPPSGFPIIIIWDSLMKGSIAAWYLDQQGNLLPGNINMTSYQIEKDKKYIMSVTWNLKNTDTHVSVPPGQYIVQVAILKTNSDRTGTFLTTKEGSFTITIS